jgi:hypothetical protein
LPLALRIAPFLARHGNSNLPTGKLETLIGLLLRLEGRTFGGVSVLSAFNFATNQAKATGALGGYDDSWLNSGLADQAAGRTIGIGNLFANETKCLIAPEQQLAGEAAYQTPSRWPGLMQGAGNVLASASGNQSSSLVQGLNGALNGLQLGTPYMG